MNKKILLWIIGIILLTILAVSSGLDSIVEIWKSVPISYLLGFLVAMALLQVFTIGLTVYQWFFLLKNSSQKISFSSVFSIHLAGLFVESVTPSSKFGGEIVKIYLLKQKTSLNYNQLTTCLIAHKYISLLPFLVLCLIVLVSAPFNFVLPSVVYLTFGILSLTVFILILLIYKQGKIGAKVVDRQKKKRRGKLGIFFKIYDKILIGIFFVQEATLNVKDLMNKPKMKRLFLISFVIWLLYPVKIFLASTILNLPVNFILAMIVTFAAFLVSMIPISPGGLGTFEGSMALILMFNGFLFAEGMAIALLARLVTYWFPLFMSAGTSVYLVKSGKFSLFGTKKQVK